MLTRSLAFISTIALFFGCTPITRGPGTPPNVEAKSPPTLATTPPQADGLATRSSPIRCDNAPCTLTVEITGAKSIPSNLLFKATRALELAELNDEVWERDTFALASVYYDHGYLHVSVAPPTLTRSPDGRSTRAHFVIVEGPQFRIHSYEGTESINDVTVAPMGNWTPSLKPGDIFNRSVIAADSMQLRRIYGDLGYAEVMVEPMLDLDESKREVKIRTVVKRGEVHTFGPIRIVGLQNVTEVETRRYLQVAAGQRYSETNLLQTKEALRASGLFDRIDISTKRGESPRITNVMIEVTEKPR